MPLKRLGLVHTALLGSAVAPERARLMQLGRCRGGPTPTGGFFIEIVGNGEARRAEMTPRETAIVAQAMFEAIGVKLDVDFQQFRHIDG